MTFKNSKLHYSIGILNDEHHYLEIYVNLFLFLRF